MTVHVSNKEESPQMDNGGYSGSQLVHHFRSVLDAVKTVTCCRFRKVLWVLFNSNFIVLLPKGIKAGLLWFRVIEGITTSL